MLTSLVHPEKQKLGFTFDKRPTGPVASFLENSFLSIELFRCQPFNVAALKLLLKLLTDLVLVAQVRDLRW